jgi:hypothetical protein
MATRLFENKNLSITHDEKKGYLFLKWNGFLNSDGFRKAALEVIKAIVQTKAQAILSDNTEWKIITPNDYGWAAYNWFPEAEIKGIKKLATILSSDYFNRISEKSIENMAEVRCMEIRNFQTIEEAQKWLDMPKISDCVTGRDELLHQTF